LDPLEPPDTGSSSQAVQSAKTLKTLNSKDVETEKGFGESARAGLGSMSSVVLLQERQPLALVVVLAKLGPWAISEVSFGGWGCCPTAVEAEEQ
jgi:hypothetical protein